MKWFKHETDAHTNLKLQSVIDIHGVGAFGFYWICVELVGLQGENFKLSPEKNWKNYLKKFSGLHEDTIETLLDCFAKTNLIDKRALSRGILYIPKLEERQDEYTQKLRRKSGHNPENVVLEEKREEKNRREDKPEHHLSFLEKLPDDILTTLSEKYKISPQGIQSKATDLLLYCQSRSKQYKNYKAFLENAIRKDKQDLQNKFTYVKKVEAPPPAMEAIAPEEKEKIEARKAQIREGLKPRVAG